MTDHCPACPFAACDDCRYQPPARAATATPTQPATDEETLP